MHIFVIFVMHHWDASYWSLNLRNYIQNLKGSVSIPATKFLFLDIFVKFLVHFFKNFIVFLLMFLLPILVFAQKNPLFFFNDKKNMPDVSILGLRITIWPVKTQPSNISCNTCYNHR